MFNAIISDMEAIDIIKKKYGSYSPEQLFELVAQMQTRIDDLTNALFASKSEKRGTSKYINPDQPSLFNEPEELSDYEAEEKEAAKDTITVGEHQRKKNRGKRTKLSEDLPRKKNVIDLPENKKICPKHNTEMVKIGKIVKEKLVIIPEQVYVEETVILTFKCPECDKDSPTANIVSSKGEPELLPKTIATPSLLAYIVTRKYQDGLPLYRLESIFERHGISIPRSTMARWIIALKNPLMIIMNLFKEDLLNQSAIGCDETVVQVLKEPNRNPQTKSYMWVTIGLDGPPIRLFQYDTGRGEKTARKVLDDYQGVIVCDGLKTYSALARKTPGIVLAGCFAHVRRKFFQADKALKKAAPKKIPKSKVPLDLIDKLFKIESKLSGKDHETILRLRKSESDPILKELKEWCDEQEQKTLPTSLLGKAISYTISQWDTLQTFLEYPQIPIHNNHTEGAIRPFVIGRKAWLFSASTDGADASACLYSIVET